MDLLDIVLSKKVVVAAAVALVVSVFLTFFPLIGTLGFEYSVIMAFFMSFVSIFISAEYINLDLKKKYPMRKRYSDLISTSFFINFIILLIPFLVGLISSLIKSDCYLREGLAFFLLITTITVFFASTLGLLIGYFFPKRGFFLGSLCVFAIIIYSLYVLYSQPPVFSYNHIFGLFPGPIYDQIILIDEKILTFRAVTICWGIFFLLVLKLIHDYRFRYIGIGTVALFIFISLIITAYKIYENNLGIKHTRHYIQNTIFKDYFETEHFIIYFPLGTEVSQNIELIALDHEWQYAQLTEYLNVSPEKKIVSYIYADEKTRKKIIGAGQTTIANPIHSEIHLVYGFYPHPVLKHELVHILSSEFASGILKISPKVGLIEGLAVAADWDNSDGFDPDQWSAAMLKSDNNIDIQNILGYGFWAAASSKSYTLMGSFVRFLISEYGIEDFKTVYNTGDFSVYETDLSALINQWKDHLGTVEIAKSARALSKHKYSKPGIFDDSCPRKSSHLADVGISEFEKGNYYEAVQSFKKALNYNPRSNRILESLAYSYYYDKDFHNLSKIAERKTRVSQVSRDIILNLIGTYHWTRGDSDKGREIFSSLYNNPLPVDIQNELSIKLDSLTKNDDSQQGLKQYYMTKKELRRISALDRLTKQYPDYAVPYYLLGKLFFNKWEFDIARDYLLHSERLGLPTDKLKLENSRLLGISLYAGGQYDKARMTFEGIYENRKSGRYGSVAADFIKRSKWAKIYSFNK
ncbi:MAG TPA: hypothetical protein VLB82_05305 [Thermodesulfobacteriota bacterium]|nr:hypothetical protein [Thermodesulfobacteriota bacterium]